MHALQSLGFALGADAAPMESDLVTRRTQGNVNIAAIQGTGRTGLATDAGKGVVVTSSGDVVAPGSSAASSGHTAISSGGLFGIPWLYVAGGVVALGAAWIVLKKKRSPTLSDFAQLAGFGRRRRRRLSLRG